MKKAFALAAVLAVAASASAFDVIIEGDDSAANTSYNYSTYVSGNPTAVVIPAAPSAAGTTGLRLDVNTTTASVDSITVYPVVSTLNLASGNFTLTFDVFPQHNGDAGGATGSTEFFTWGAAAAPTNGNTTGTNGFVYALTGDGGSGTDARYFSGATTPLAAANIGAGAPNWWGADAVNNTATQWVAFYPNDGTLGTPVAAAILAGAPGKQWTTVRLTVTNGGADRLVEFKKPGDAGFTAVSTITGGVGSSARPFVGLLDLFTSVGNPGADQFTVFDNIVISDGTTSVTYNFEPATTPTPSPTPAPLAAENWTNYN